ncbi:hypothetical protein EX30DRAFT_342763 [Ascodesmis nigricans]|uniref:Uncharacterized protein n=1 Tax=Ascodesmis nigricans TaxID=341454 RepID=A0A4V3SI65_9PEZI|nr:hypothetical protein EX30DRAFT_342763 [Ascodesmis nigricans]
MDYVVSTGEWDAAGKRALRVGLGITVLSTCISVSIGIGMVRVIRNQWDCMGGRRWDDGWEG